jgi:hypothetical protein
MGKCYAQAEIGEIFKWGDKTWKKTEVVFINCCTKRNAVNVDNDGDIRYFQDEEIVEID